MNDNIHQQEIERIRREYERRSHEIPQDYYSPEHPGNRYLALIRKERFDIEDHHATQ